MTNFIIKYFRQIIFICILLGIAFACLIPFSRTDPEIRNYIPGTMKSRVETDSIEKEFGVQDMIIILFRDSCIVTPENLERIRSIDNSLADMSRVTSRISPFTVRKITSSDGMMLVEPLIDTIPSDTAGLRRLRQDILSNRFARDIAFSTDLTVAAISATLDNVSDETGTLHRIDSIIAMNPGKAEVMKGGLPVIRQHIMTDVRRDAVFLVPLALLVMLSVLKLTLGEWKMVLMPFAVVVISTLVSIGLVPLLGWKFSIITVLVPVILVAVANNYGIYLTARFQEITALNGNMPREAILKELLGSLNMPIIFSGLTTIAGILGLLTHSIIPARQLGVLAATGVTFALVISLLLVPSFIYAGKPGKDSAHSSAARKNFLESATGIIGAVVVGHPKRILWISAVFTILMSGGIFLLKTETNQEKFFPEKSQVRQTSNLINSKFGGSQTISVMVSGDIMDPAIMGRIDSLTRSCSRITGVGNVFSISTAVREMSKALYTPGEEGYDMIPSTRSGIAQLFELYNMSGDPSDLKQMINLDYTRAHILVRLSDPRKSVIENVRKEISMIMPGIPARVTTGGYAIIMSDFAVSVIRGQVASLLFALATVFILLAIIFRSVKGGLIGSIPLFASILILFGFMGIVHIALDSATALLSSIMIGVGVDFTIQYVWCFNLCKNEGLSWEEATKKSLSTIGRSIIINAFSVMAGFSALVLSGFTSIRFFGYLVLISMGSCLFGAIILVPAILLILKPAFAERNMSKSLKRK